MSDISRYCELVDKINTINFRRESTDPTLGKHLLKELEQEFSELHYSIWLKESAKPYWRERR